MTGKREHINFVEEALSLYKARCRTDEAHAISDLICDLGHYAEEHGIDFLQQVKNGVAHWTAEKTVNMGASTFVDIEIEIKTERKALDMENA